MVTWFAPSVNSEPSALADMRHAGTPPLRSASYGTPMAQRCCIQAGAAFLRWLRPGPTVKNAVECSPLRAARLTSLVAPLRLRSRTSRVPGPVPTNTGRWAPSCGCGALELANTALALPGIGLSRQLALGQNIAVRLHNVDAVGPTRTATCQRQFEHPPGEPSCASEPVLLF